MDEIVVIRLKRPHATILAPVTAPQEQGGFAVLPFYTCTQKNYLTKVDMKAVDDLPPHLRIPFLADLARYAKNWHISCDWEGMRIAQGLAKTEGRTAGSSSSSGVAAIFIGL